jgi:Rab GDP dissociation inhibitor
MLNKSGLEVLFDESNVFTGVKDAAGQVAKAPVVVGDPSYFVSKTKVTSKVVRAICIMNHAIPDTNNSHSVQLIIPYSQVGRQHDIYVFCSSYRYALAMPVCFWIEVLA